MPKIKTKSKIGKIDYLSVYVASFIINLIIVALFFVSREHLPAEIPLFYGNASGQAQVAPRNYLSLPQIIAITTSALNLAISANLRDKFLKQTLAALTISTTILAAIAVIKIFFLVSNL